MYLNVGIMEETRHKHNTHMSKVASIYFNWYLLCMLLLIRRIILNDGKGLCINLN